MPILSLVIYYIIRHALNDPFEKKIFKASLNFQKKINLKTLILILLKMRIVYVLLRICENNMQKLFMPKNAIYGVFADVKYIIRTNHSLMNENTNIYDQRSDTEAKENYMESNKFIKNTTMLYILYCLVLVFFISGLLLEYSKDMKPYSLVVRVYFFVLPIVIVMLYIYLFPYLISLTITSPIPSILCWFFLVIGFFIGFLFSLQYFRNFLLINPAPNTLQDSNKM